MLCRGVRNSSPGWVNGKDGTAGQIQKERRYRRSRHNGVEVSRILKQTKTEVFVGLKRAIKSNRGGRRTVSGKRREVQEPVGRVEEVSAGGGSRRRRVGIVETVLQEDILNEGVQEDKAARATRRRWPVGKGSGSKLLVQEDGETQQETDKKELDVDEDNTNRQTHKAE